jgi:hypothetical protein
MFDFCTDKLDFLEMGRYARRASRMEDGLRNDRGLGQELIKELTSK